MKDRYSRLERGRRTDLEVTTGTVNMIIRVQENIRDDLKSLRSNMGMCRQIMSAGRGTEIEPIVRSALSALNRAMVGFDHADEAMEEAEKAAVNERYGP